MHATSYCDAHRLLAADWRANLSLKPFARAHTGGPDTLRGARDKSSLDTWHCCRHLRSFPLRIPSMHPFGSYSRHCRCPYPYPHRYPQVCPIGTQPPSTIPFSPRCTASSGWLVLPCVPRLGLGGLPNNISSPGPHALRWFRSYHPSPPAHPYPTPGLLCAPTSVSCRASPSLCSPRCLHCLPLPSDPRVACDPGHGGCLVRRHWA